MNIVRLLAAALMWAVSAPILAACSRPIQVPVAPIGLSLVVKGAEVSGIFPDILKEMGGRYHCQFIYRPVPRARLEAMFEAGQADLLVPAPRTERRDRYGVFVPMVQARATVVSVGVRNDPVHSLAQLKGLGLRVAVVRGFDYGEPYQRFLRDYAASGRLFTEVDAAGVARLLHAGFADVALITPTVLAGTIIGDPRVAGLLERLRIEPVDELGWTESGIYLSRSSLNDADRAELGRMLTETAHSSLIWDAYKRYYPASILAASLRPR